MVKRFNADSPSPRQEKFSMRVQELFSAMVVRDQIINIKPLDLTINAVSVSPDLRQASIFVVPQPSGSGKKARTAEKIMANLNNARKFIRSQIAKELTSKNCPELSFFYDDAAKHSAEFDELLGNIK